MGLAGQTRLSRTPLRVSVSRYTREHCSRCVLHMLFKCLLLSVATGEGAKAWSEPATANRWSVLICTHRVVFSCLIWTRSIWTFLLSLLHYDWPVTGDWLQGYRCN